MKFSTQVIVFLYVLCCYNHSNAQTDKLILNGSVIGTTSKSVMLIKPDQDARFDAIVEIPIVDGKFHYESQLEYPEVVNLAFSESVNNGAYRPMPIFLENEHMDVTLYPEHEFERNTIKGGKLNAAYTAFEQQSEDQFYSRIKPLKDSMSVLFKNDEYNSDQAKLIYAALREAKTQDEKLVLYEKLKDLEKSDEKLSPKAKVLKTKIEPITDEFSVFRQDYIDNNPTLVSYYLLLEDLKWHAESIDMDAVKNNYQMLSKANPNHPYNTFASNLISAIENVKTGKKYTDFAAPDLKGNIIKLSDKITGKITLLDLWATWCGPCIAKTRTMIPLYNAYKDKGFTIVGVAGEFKNTNRLVKFLDKEKWPWLNLVELDRQNNIWQQYGVDGGGGGLFLIDDKGVIIAKDPTAKDVRKELESRLH